MIVGTCHFVNRCAAIKYYSDYHYDDVESTVNRKVEDGEIFIGRPLIKPGEKLVLLDDNTRYGIVRK